MAREIKVNYIETQKFVYSVLFGLTITNFMSSFFRFILAVCGPAGNKLDTILVVFFCIKVYFFLNCFRWLFGLLKFTEMIGNNFGPVADDWRGDGYRKNIFKKLVMNMGIIQLILFSILSIVISNFGAESYIRSYSNSNVIEEGIHTAFIWFFFIDLLILFTDAIAIYGYKKFESNITPAEQRISKNWNSSTRWEMFCDAGALFLAWYYYDYKVGMVFIGIKLMLLAFEMLGGFNYFQQQNQTVTNAPTI
jgi:hypothetical protein